MVIAHSPMIHEVGSMPYRFVIRDLGNQFVVHMEVHQADRPDPWYTTGDYFPKSDRAADVGESDKEALCKAWKRFDERVRRKLGVRDMEIASAKGSDPGDDPDYVGA